MTTIEAAPSRTPGQEFSAAVRAEASKLRSLPTIWLLLAGTLALTVVLSLAFAGNARRARFTGMELDFGVTAITWTQCGYFLLGVIAAASEYNGGQIRTTLTAIPNRVLQRLAAATALTAVAFATGIVTFCASIAAMYIAIGVPLDAIEWAATSRVLLSGAGYLTLMAVLSSALGFVIRKAIPAAAILLLYLLIVSPFLQAQSWYWLPDMASYTLWFATTPAGAPPALVSWMTILGWTLAFLIPSIAVTTRRDT